MALQNQEEEDPDAFPDVEETPIVPAQKPNVESGKIVEKEAEESADEISGEEESESETDSKPLLKPIFVGKEERATLKEREKQEVEELARLEEAKKKKEELKIETKMMIVKAVWEMVLIPID